MQPTARAGYGPAAEARPDGQWVMRCLCFDCDPPDAVGIARALTSFLEHAGEQVELLDWRAWSADRSGGVHLLVLYRARVVSGSHA